MCIPWIIKCISVYFKRNRINNDNTDNAGKCIIGKDHSFHSVILAGVHDGKNLTPKLHPDEEKINYSPWNIAADFFVDMSFSSEEIATMLKDYVQEKMYRWIFPQLLKPFLSTHPAILFLKQSMLCPWYLNPSWKRRSLLG